MTGPYRYHDYEGELGLTSDVAEKEWQQMLRRRRELMGAIMGIPGEQGPLQQAGVSPAPPSGASSVANVDPANRFIGGAPAPERGPRLWDRDRQLAVAHTWQIPDAEQMEPSALEAEIKRRRDFISRDPNTTVESAAAAAIGGFSEYAGQTARLMGNLVGLVEKIPLAGHVMKSIDNDHKAKNWFWDLSMKAVQVSEMAGMSQPESDRSAYDFVTGLGRMAGYIIPINAATKIAAAGIAGAGAGAGTAIATGVPVAATTARGLSPILKMGMAGAASMGAFSLGSDEPATTKAAEIGFGALFGAATGVGGRTAVSAMLGGLGMGAGAAIGSEKDRGRNALIGLGVGASIPFVAPVLAKAAIKVMSDFEMPWTTRYAASRETAVQRAWRPAEHDFGPEYEFKYGESGPTREPIPQQRRLQGPIGTDMDIPANVQNPPGGPFDADRLVMDRISQGLALRGRLDAAQRADFAPVMEASRGVRTEPGTVVPMEGPIYGPAIPTPQSNVMPGRSGTQLPPARVTDPTRQLMDQDTAARFRTINMYESNREDLRWSTGVDLRLATGADVQPHNRAAAAARLDDTSLRLDMYNERIGALRSEVGYRPPREEVPAFLRDTKIVNERGEPKIMYHGTSRHYEWYDPAVGNDDSEGLLFGPGHYTTDDPGIAGSYAGDIQFDGRWKPEYGEGGGAGLTRAAVPEMLAKLDAIEQAGSTHSWTQVDADWPGSVRHLLNGFMQENNSGLTVGDLMYYARSSPAALDFMSQFADITPTRMPHVRPMRLNIQNPFDIEKMHTEAEVTELIDKLEAAYPDYDWRQARYDLDLQIHRMPTPDDQMMAEVLQLPTPSPEMELKGEEIYNVLQHVTSDVKPQGPQLPGPDDATNIPVEAYLRDPVFGDKPVPIRLGKGGLNKALEAIGYDGIVHRGGRWVGNRGHNVAIAFHPEQIHLPWGMEPMSYNEVVLQAQQMTKQATVLESEILGEVLDKVKLDDTDVAAALQRANPSGVSILKGVNLDRNGLERLFAQTPNVTFIERADGGLDAMIGEFTPQQVADYKAHGLFEGQEVVTSNGYEGTVLKPSHGDKGRVMIKRPNGPPLIVSRDKVMPGRFSEPQREVPDLWNSFKADLLRWINSESTELGMAPVVDITDPRVSRVMAQHMDDFFDRMGINDPGERHALDHSFNRSLVQEFKDLDPEMRDLQDQVVNWQTMENNLAESEDNIDALLDEKAESKGFIWIPSAGTGGTLRNMVNLEAGMDIPVESDEAAEAFLENVDQVKADVTPISNVPADVAAAGPLASTLPPVLPFDSKGESLQEAIRRFAGGGGGGDQPPSGPTGAGFPEQPQLPGGQIETLQQQFRKMRRHDPATLFNLENDFTGWFGSKLRYTRYAMLGMQTNLQRAGLTKATPWEHYEADATARTIAHTEALPWMQEWAEIMELLPRKFLRNGDVVRIHEMQDRNARLSAIWQKQQTHGLSEDRVQKWIEADDKITDWFHRTALMISKSDRVDFDMDREIFRYVPHVRARQASNAPDAYGNTLSSNVSFFAEHVRDGNVQFRVMDMRELGTHYIRAAMFQMHRKEAWTDMVRAWDLDLPEGRSSPIPDGFRNYMKDYATLSRFGYDASGEIAVRGLKRMFKTFGLPITTNEASSILGAPMTGMYMAGLAGRTSIFFRDAIQPLLALSKVRVPYMVRAMDDILRSSIATKRELFQQGLDGGWIDRENPNIEGVGLFEEAGGARENELLGLTPRQAELRESLAEIGDEAYGLPLWLRKPSDSKLNTLRWYGKLGQINRMIVGRASWLQATDVIAKYRRSHVEAALERNPAKALPTKYLDEAGFFESFEPPIRQKLHALVANGADKEAANLFAKEVSNWSQMRYGRREMPQALRGGFGRAMTTFGSFSGQLAEATWSAGFKNGTPRQKVRFWMTNGSIAAGLAALTAYTGWNFRNWIWTTAFQYTGGPLAERLVTDISALTGSMNQLGGKPVSPTQEAAMFQTEQRGWLPGAADIFPYSGYVRSAAELSSAMQGINPLEQAARYSVVGDRGSRVDMRRMLEQLAQQQDSARAAQLGDPGFPEGSLSPNGGTWRQQTPMSPGAREYLERAAKSHPGSGAQY